MNVERVSGRESESKKSNEKPTCMQLEPCANVCTYCAFDISRVQADAGLRMYEWLDLKLWPLQFVYMIAVYFDGSYVCVCVFQWVNEWMLSVPNSILLCHVCTWICHVKSTRSRNTTQKLSLFTPFSILFRLNA